MYPIFSAISFSIGAAIDEAQGGHNGDNYVFDRSSSCSNARLLLVLKWIVVGYFLTMSYRAVLRSQMMTKEYEKPIDTLDDMIESDINLLAAGDTLLRQYLEGDPRPKVRKLREKQKIEYFEFGSGMPKRVTDG